jgi:hypothetical protein
MSLTNITVNGIFYTAADIAAAAGNTLPISLPYNYNVVEIIAVASGGSTLEYSFYGSPANTIFYSEIPLILNITPSTPFLNITVDGTLSCRLNITNEADTSPGVVETIFNATQGAIFTTSSGASTTVFNLIAIINNRYIYQTNSNTTSLYPSSVYKGSTGSLNTTLTAVTIPSTITNWNNTDFSNCNDLASIIFTEGLVTIPQLLCFNCQKLSSVIIPDSVTSIGELAFTNCISLSNVIIGANVLRIDQYAFTASYAPNITYTFNVNSSSTAPSYLGTSSISTIFTVPTASISVSIATSNINYAQAFSTYNSVGSPIPFIIEGYASNLVYDNSEGLIIDGGASNLIASNNRLLLNDKGINFLSPGTGELNIQRSYFRNTNDNGFYVKDFSSNLALFSSNNVGLIMQNLASTLEVVSSVLVTGSNLLSLDFSSDIGSIIQVTNSTANFVLNLVNLGIVPGQSVTICLVISGSSYANIIRIDGINQVENIYTSVNTSAPAGCSYVLQTITILRTDTNRYKLIVNLLPLNTNSSVFPV